MNAAQIARALHAKLVEHGYPYYAVSLHTDGLFHYLENWNDSYPASQVIVCYARAEDCDTAQQHALRLAQRQTIEGAPCGVVACVATADLEIVEVE